MARSPLLARASPALPRNFASSASAPQPRVYLRAVSVTPMWDGTLLDDQRVLELAQFNRRVDNWVRVARFRGWLSWETCASAEGRYRAPSDDNAALDEADRIEAEQRSLKRWSWEPDIVDGWKVEDAWRFMPDTPVQFRRMLALVLHRRRFASRARLAYELRIRRDDFPNLLRKARAMLRNRLRTLET